MSTQYHFDNMIFTSREAHKNAVENDWYKKYNKYMIQEFLYIGRQVVFKFVLLVSARVQYTRKD